MNRSALFAFEMGMTMSTLPAIPADFQHFCITFRLPDNIKLLHADEPTVTRIRETIADNFAPGILREKPTKKGLLNNLRNHFKGCAHIKGAVTEALRAMNPLVCSPPPSRAKSIPESSLARWAAVSSFVGASHLAYQAGCVLTSQSQPVSQIL